MILVAIKATKSSSRANLVFNTGLILPFSVDQLSAIASKKGNNLDQDTFNSIVYSSILFLSKEYSLRQIAMSPKTSQVIEDKLKLYIKRTLFRKKLDAQSIDISSVVNSVIDYLNQKKLLSEDQYVKYFINKSKNKSKKHIKYLLAQKGIKNISQDDFSSLSDYQTIMTILNKKAVNPELFSDFKQKNKIVSYLARKGFDLDDIFRAIDDYLNTK